MMMIKTLDSFGLETVEYKSDAGKELKW